MEGLGPQEHGGFGTTRTWRVWDLKNMEGLGPQEHGGFRTSRTWRV